MENKPIKKFKAGHCHVSIWKNTAKNKEGQEYEFESVKVEKVYKDGEEFKSTNNYKVSELGDLKMLIEETHKYLRLKEE